MNNVKKKYILLQQYYCSECIRNDLICLINKIIVMVVDIRSTYMNWNLFCRWVYVL